MTKKKPEAEPERPSWRHVVEGAIQQALDNPDEFVNDAKVLVKKVQGAVKDVNQRLKDDQGAVGRVARNSVVKNGARWLKRKLDEIDEKK